MLHGFKGNGIKQIGKRKLFIKDSVRAKDILIFSLLYSYIFLF